MIDPKKALAAQDAQGDQAEIEARGQLVEMVTGGLPPDELAASITRADWAGELTRAAVAVGIILWLPGVRQSSSELFFFLYLAFVFPAWTVWATWAPLRGRRPHRILSDLLYQVQASIQGLLMGFFGCWVAAGLVELVAGRIHRYSDAGEVVLLSMVGAAGVAGTAWATGRALVDREIEALPRRALPPVAELELARQDVSALPVLAALARSGFRAALLMMVTVVPVVALRSWGYWPWGRDLAQAILIGGTLLAASNLGRSVLTIAMAREASLDLLARARALPAPGAGDADALVPESPASLAWQRFRSPAGMLVPVMASVTASGLIIEHELLFGSTAGGLIAMALGTMAALTIGETSREDRGPLVRGLAGAGLGAGVYLVISACFPAAMDAARHMGGIFRRLGSPLVVLATMALTERLVTLWATGVARLAGRTGAQVRDAAWTVLVRALTAGVLPGAALFALGIVLTHFREYSLGNAVVGTSVFTLPLVAILAGARMRLEEAMAPAALPASHGGEPAGADAGAEAEAADPGALPAGSAAGHGG